jgi:hypothetical protein
MVPGIARVLEAAGLSGTRRGVGGVLVRRIWWGIAAAMLAAGTAVAAGPREAPPAPPLRIPLIPLGFQTLQQDFLLAGSSMLTVDFVDNDHLLVTFGIRRLMHRVQDDPVDDDDRTIAALLLELPTGKVLARTEWRLHDRAQYLWNLGHGRFLLRVKDRLTMIAPLEPGNASEPFREITMLHTDRHIVAIQVSSDDDLMMLETTKWSLGAGAPNQGFSTEANPVQISFYRLKSGGPNGLLVSNAGTIRTKTAVALPLTTAGRLDVLDGGRNRWLFNFDEHAGKVDELAAWDSTCFPQPVFVGHGEFVAFGCRGASDKVVFAGFNLKGEEMWQQNFFDSHISPTFSFAPEAGRFALGRTIISGEFDPELPLPSVMVNGQEVRVYQSYDGKQLFKIDLTPVARAGQNFSLSPDGMRLAVVRETLVRHPATQDDPAYSQTEAGLEVYALPGLSAQDKAAVKEAQTMAPADTGARIDLALERETAHSDAGSADGSGEKVRIETGSGAPSPAAAEAEASAQKSAGEASNDGGKAGDAAIIEGDAQPTGPRKPPSLYGPNEQPDQQKQPTPP